MIIPSSPLSDGPDQHIAPDDICADHRLMQNFLHKPGFLLARIEQISTALFGRLMDGVTLSQAEFLLLLSRSGPMIQIAIARAAGVDKSTTAYIIDNLQSRGWIERTVREQDRRSSLISLTAAGKALIPDLERCFAMLQQQLARPLEQDGDADWLVGCLHRLVAIDGVGPIWHPVGNSETDVLGGAISFLARRALQLLHAQFLISTGGTGLTLRQFSLLFILSQRAFITQIEFARIFGLDPATCGVIMRGPTRRGFIQSARSEQDKRARVYHITPLGRELLRTVHPAVDASADRIFGNESKKHQEKMIRQMRLIVMEYSKILKFPGAIKAG